MRSAFLVFFLAALSFQNANALTVTLESDFRVFDHYDFGSLQDRQRATFGADFSYSTAGNFYGNQVSGVPNQSDPNTYIFSGEGASYSYGGGFSNISRYEISFTADQDATFNFDAVFDNRGGTLGHGDYEVYFWEANGDYNGGASALLSESATVYQGSPVSYDESFQLTGGNTYFLKVLTVGSPVSGDDSSYVGFDFNASVTTVPVPAAVWFFGSGLGLLGLFRRRQTA
jgi:hypothetical protein